jgi:hypothetical protein
MIFIQALLLIKSLQRNLAILLMKLTINKQQFIKMEFFKDLWNFLKVRKKFWLLPIIIILLLFGVLIVLTSGSAIAPFIYTLF